MIIPGIIASRFTPQGDYESIATVSLTGTQASIEFTSIPATYQHLQIRGIGRMNSAVVNRGLVVRVNNDNTTTNYYSHYLEGNGSAASSGANADDLVLYDMSGASATTSGFGAIVIDILDYANTNKFKTFRGLGGYDNNGSGRVYLTSGMWENSGTAISSIKLTPLLGASWVQYSHFALYGIKG